MIRGLENSVIEKEAQGVSIFSLDLRNLCQIGKRYLKDTWKEYHDKCYKK